MSGAPAPEPGPAPPSPNPEATPRHAPSRPDPGPSPRSAPTGPGDLFVAFTRMALQGFGGVLPIAQRELVERLRWIDVDEFLRLLSLAQVLPGPNIVNLALMIGDRHFGTRGALAALAGILLAPLGVVLALAAAAAHGRDLPLLAGALRGMGVVAAGLVAATALKLSRPLMRGPLGAPTALALALLTAVVIGVLRWPLLAAVVGIGGGATWLARRALRRADAAAVGTGPAP